MGDYQGVYEKRNGHSAKPGDENDRDDSDDDKDQEEMAADTGVAGGKLGGR